MRTLVTGLICIAVPLAYGSVIREVSIPSPSMDKEVPASVILPDAYETMAETAKLKNGEVEIVSFIGTSDIFLEPNRRMHKLLSDNKVAHTYIEIRGKDDKSSGHDFSFSRNSSCWAVVVSFFRSYFDTGCGRLVSDNNLSKE